MEISEMKELVKGAVNFAGLAESFVSQTEDSAEVCAKISIAKSLAAIAAALVDTTGEHKSGKKYIRTYDQSPSGTI